MEASQMGNFILSAFADEIDMDLAVQMEVLEQHGINHIEMRGVNGKNISDVTLEEAYGIKKQLDAKGFKISALGSPIGKIKITEDFEGDKAKFVHTLELAKVLETNYIRMFSFFIPEGEEAWPYRVEVIKRWQEYIALAKDKNVILLHENEKDIYGDTKERCKDVFDTLACDYIQATFDPANFVQVGEDTLEAFELLKSHIAYMHIKDATGDGEVVPAGYGIGHVEEILRQLKADGYVGFLSLEPHLSDFKGFADLEGDNTLALKERDSKETFKLAVTALKEILDRI